MRMRIWESRKKDFEILPLVIFISQPITSELFNKTKFTSEPDFNLSILYHNPDLNNEFLFLFH